MATSCDAFAADVNMFSPGGAEEEAADRAAVVVLPPLVYLLSVLLGVAAKYVFGGEIGLGDDSWGDDIRLVSGWALIAAGFFIGSAFIRTFWKTGQDPDPRTPTPTLLVTGLYRFSRNPAYLGLTAIQLGLGLVLDNPWIILMLIPVVAVIYYGVILPEEAYLQRKFGNEFQDYKTRVRRWI